MSERDRPAAAPSWLVTLGGAALLIVLGFAIGLVAGVAYEEPDLVMEQLAGRTTQVALADLDAAEPAEEGMLVPSVLPLAETPPVAAAPPAPAPTARPGAGPGQSDGFAVQVGAFGQAAGAQQLVEELRSLGFSAYLAPAGPEVPAPFRVRVGPVASRDEAERLAATLKAGHRLPTWVLIENRP